MVNVAGASKGNRSTEGRFTEILRRKKLKGWRRGLLLYGKPDFVFIKARIAVFIDGCFWHGCPLHGEIPPPIAIVGERKLAVIAKEISE